MEEDKTVVLMAGVIPVVVTVAAWVAVATVAVMGAAMMAAVTMAVVKVEVGKEGVATVAAARV